MGGIVIYWDNLIFKGALLVLDLSAILGLQLMA